MTPRRTRYLIVTALCIALLFALTIHYGWLSSPNEGSESLPPYSLSLELEVANESSQLLPHSTVTFYPPLPYSATQRLGELTASEPYSSRLDDWGNQIMDIQVKDIVPYGKRFITFEVQLNVGKTGPGEALDSAALQPYLARETPLSMENADIQALASSFNASSAVDAIFQWLQKNIQYEGYVKDDRPASYAMTHRRGDCTEFTYLSLALLRLNQIPARGMLGFVFDSEAGSQPFLHNWVEYYQNGRWILFDPQLGHLDKGHQQYTAIRVLAPDERGTFDSSRFFGRRSSTDASK
ncbi:MAG: transglutaminase domain-containing protein [Hahellaceae bacterium]|nr:transglutaminase domain-containing protein [Hahellaceae bacterium]